MSLDPAIFEAEAERLGVTWPERGAMIRFRRRSGRGHDEWKLGTVKVVWLALDAVAIDLEDGAAALIPEFGDEYEIVPHSAQVGASWVWRVLSALGQRRSRTA